MTGVAVGMLEIPDINSVLVDDLRKPGNWVVANVQTNSYWPVKPQKVGYRGEDIWILPVMKGYFPSVAMSVPAGKSRDECSKLLMRFLSSLSWVERHGITVDGFTGGSLPRPLGREKTMGFSISDEFELEYLPEPVDERALLALALMREGRALNHPAYAFLSFYRVLEVALPNGKKRGPWIDDHIEVVTDPRAKEAIASLRAGGVADVGNHLYRTNRQAIAHATEAPIVDPDDPSHDRRLWSEMPIIAGLAELAIEKVLGVETSATVYAQHLYELAGFKKIFGPELREQIARGDRLGESTVVNIPQMDVRIRGREPYQPLLNMEPVQVGHQHGLVYLVP